MVNGHYPLATGHWSLVTGHWSLVTGHWSLITGHWSLVTSHWSLVTSHWSLITGYFPTQNLEKISFTSSSLVSLASIISISESALSRVKHTISGVSPKESASLA